MNIYVWHRTAPVSDYFHNAGGLLVVAANLADARERAKATIGDVADIDAAGWLTADPDHFWDVGTADPLVMVFPDVGCC